MQEFPTTNNYIIGTNVNLRSETLSKHFHDITHNKQPSTQIAELVKSVLGRDNIDVIVGDHSKNEYNFSSAGDSIHLDPKQTNVAVFLGVSDDNLPPNVPRDLTQDLLNHLIALHESEHATQLHLPEDPNTGKIDFRLMKSNLVQPNVSGNDLNYKIIGETDADIAVLDHLNDLELNHIGQFWKDSRMTVSFVGSFPAITSEALEHDTSSLLSYYQDTGQVIDMDTFVEEKKALLNKVHEEFNFSPEKLMSIVKEYPDFFTNEKARLFMSSQEGNISLSPTPQAIKHAVQNLLDKGELSGLQTWEAQNYISAMERLGYKENPDFNYEAQIRDTLENKIGLKPLSQQTANALSNSEPPVPS